MRVHIPRKTESLCFFVHVVNMLVLHVRVRDPSAAVESGRGPPSVLRLSARVSHVVFLCLISLGRGGRHIEYLGGNMQDRKKFLE